MSGLCRHPGGVEMTARLVALASLEPCRILDMGAGSGETLRHLLSLGYDAVGIDLKPGEGVIEGNFLRCPFDDGSFDAVISECALFVSGDADAALGEISRLLRQGGKLLLGDVCFDGLDGLRRRLARAGLELQRFEDITKSWKEYYIECLWRGTAEEFCSGLEHTRPEYFLTVSERM